MAFINLSELPLAVKRFGGMGTLTLLTSRRRLRNWLPRWTNDLQLREYPFRFQFRHATTDKYAIVEIFLRDQYDCLRGMSNVRTIVDAGANIGSASVFLLNAYPEARVIALEPDAGNFAMLEKNLSRYGARAVPLQRALWHRPESVSVERGTYGGGGEWALQVRPSESGAAGVAGTTLPELLETYGLDTIDILKVDIEGAERHVFGDASAWLGKVRTIAIELHEREDREAFARAIADHGGQTSRHGELTVWKRE